MTEFDPFASTPTGPVEHNPFAGQDESQQQVSSTQVGKDRKKVLLPVVTGRSKEEVSDAVDVDAVTQFEEEARGQASLATQTRAQEAFSLAATEEKDPQQAILSIVDKVAGSEYLSTFLDTSVMSTILTSDNDLAKRSYLNKFEKVLILHDLMLSKMESADETPWWRDFDFVDSLTASIPVYSNVLANRRASMASEIGQLVSSELSNEDFSQRVNDLLTEAANQGIFTSENKFFLADLYALLDEGGEGSEAVNQQFWAWFDTASLAGGVGRLGVTALRGKEVASAASDAATLLGRTGRDKEVIRGVLTTTVLKDSPQTSSVNLGSKAPAAVVPTRDRSFYLTAPEASALREMEMENDLLRSFLTSKGPEALDDELFEDFKNVFVQAARDSAEETGSKQVIDFDVSRDNLDNIFYTELWGTKTGKYFKSQTNAQKLADDVGGEVVPVSDGQWAVSLVKNVPVAPGGGNTLSSLRLFASTNPDELGYGFWAKWGSPLAQTTDRLNSVLKQSESFRDRILTESDKGLRKAIRQAGGKKAVKAVDNVYALIRDGEESWRRTPYNTSEFKQRFYRVNGREASEGEVELYHAMQKRNDVSYFLQADVEFKNAVNKGIVILEQDGFDLKVIRRSVDDVPEGDILYDFDTKRLVVKDDIPEGAFVYSASDQAFKTPFGEKVQYVISRNPRTRRIYHSDVLGYNPGGSRIYVGNQANMFVKQNREDVLASGRPVSSSPLTILGVRLQDEAVKATDQLNNILEAFGSRVSSSLDTDTILAQIKNLKDDADLNRVIRANNEFNPSIQDASDFADFMRRTGLVLDRKVDWVSDGSTLSSTGTNYLPGVDPSKTIVETFQINSTQRGGRKNEVLLGYGGQEVRAEPAIQSIKKGFTQSVSARTEAAYIAASVNGLMKTLMENPQALRKPLDNDLVGLSLKAKLRKLKEYINDNTVEGRKLGLERDKIEFRTHLQPDYRVALERFKDGVANSLYGKGFKRTAEAIDMFSADPIAATRGWVFDAFLGAFAWDQYYVQASQVFNIFGEAGIDSLRGAALYPITRFALLNGNKDVLNYVSRLVAPVVGIKPEEYVEMVEMLKESGRTVLGISIAELGEDAAFTGGIQRAREAGRFFFNEGELVARITAQHTSYIRYLKKFKKSPNSQAGRRWLAHDQDILTNAMTSASRSPYQNVPGLQFLTYMWRVGEAMTSGTFGLGGKKVLTNKQKLSLFATHSALFGLSGIPAAGYLFDRLYAKGGVDVPEEYHTGVRYGMLDVLLSEVVGSDTALSSRLAWGEGVTQFISNAMDAKLLEALAGPSGSFTTDATGHLVRTIRDIAIGSPELAKQDLNLFFRQFKSYNMTYSAYLGLRVGDYVSRTGTSVMADDVTVNESIALGLGIPLERFVSGYKLQSIMYSDSKFEKATAKELDRMAVSYRRAIQEDDFDLADKLGKQMALVLHALPPDQAERVRNGMKKHIFSTLDETYFWAMKRDLQVHKGNQE